jgi:hypothetical protein
MCSAVVRNGSVSQRKSSRELVPTCLYQNQSRALGSVRLRPDLQGPPNGYSSAYLLALEESQAFYLRSNANPPESSGTTLPTKQPATPVYTLAKPVSAQRRAIRCKVGAFWNVVQIVRKCTEEERKKQVYFFSVGAYHNSQLHEPAAS